MADFHCPTRGTDDAELGLAIGSTVEATVARALSSMAPSADDAFATPHDHVPVLTLNTGKDSSANAASLLSKAMRKQKRKRDDGKGSRADYMAMSALKPGVLVGGTVMRVTGEQITLMLHVRQQPSDKAGGGSPEAKRRLHARVHISDVWSAPELVVVADGSSGSSGGAAAAPKPDDDDDEAAPIPSARGAARSRATSVDQTKKSGKGATKAASDDVMTDDLPQSHPLHACRVGVELRNLRVLAVGDIGKDVRLVDLAIGTECARDTSSGLAAAAAPSSSSSSSSSSSCSLEFGAPRPTWSGDDAVVVGKAYRGVIVDLVSAAHDGRRDGAWVALSPEVRGFVDVLDLCDSLDDIHQLIAQCEAASASSASASVSASARPPHDTGAAAAALVGRRVSVVATRIDAKRHRLDLSAQVARHTATATATAAASKNETNEPFPRRVVARGDVVVGRLCRGLKAPRGPAHVVELGNFLCINRNAKQSSGANALLQARVCMTEASDVDDWVDSPSLKSKTSAAKDDAEDDDDDDELQR